MKKTVFILTLLLGTTIAFGQNVDQQPTKMPTSTEFMQMQNKNAAILNNNFTTKKTKPTFTKEEPLYTISFNDTSMFDRGVLPSHDINPNYTGEWAWIKDYTENSFIKAKVGPGFAIEQTRIVPYNFWTANPSVVFESPTRDNGFFIIAPMQNSPSTFNGKTSVSGTVYNAYLKFKNPFNVSELTGVDINFYQWLRKFNTDKYFVEWSTDNVTWDSIEINIKFEDIDVLEISRGMKTVALPAAAAGQETLYLRFRFSANSTGNSTGDLIAGYVWGIDDLTITQSPEYRIETSMQTFSDGAFHQIPYGLKMPNVKWRTSVKNTGMDPVDAQGIVEVLNGGPKGETANKPIPTIKDSLTTLSFGFTESDPGAQNLQFPSNTTASYAVTSRVISDLADPVYYTDTFIVNTYGQGENFKRTWGRDNGVLIEGSGFNYGKDNSGSTTWKEEDSYTRFKDYMVRMAYPMAEIATGGEFDTVWANGIEIVAASPYTAPGAKIDVFLTWDSTFTDDLGDNYVVYVRLAERIGTMITQDDLSTFTDYPYTSNPKRKYIVFDEPVPLKSGITYRASYNPTEDDTQFQLGMDYGFTNYPTFGIGFYGNVAITQGTGAGSTSYCPFIVGAPMIHLVVGPKKDRSGIDPVAKAYSFKLSNSPNPARDYTTIKYTLTSKANVKIEVRDLMGRVVKSISQGSKAPGEYTYDLSTSDLAAGTYFYSMNVNGSVQTKKLVVTK